MNRPSSPVPGFYDSGSPSLPAHLPVRQGMAPQGPVLQRRRVVDLAGLPEITDNSLLHTAIQKAVEADSSIKDFMVHEGREIWVACARGKLRLADIIDCPSLTGPVTRQAIFYFVVVHLMGATTSDQAKANSDILKSAMERSTSYSNSIRLSWGSKIRISLFRQGKGQLALVGRVTSLLLPALDKIGLPPQAVTAVRNTPRGLILLTGPMSAGKTATAQAILQYRNMTTTGHIMTVEDPIETSLVSDKCLITSKEVGADVTSFLEGLKDALRQAVDVLLIGEMRDAETIKTALSAAGSGMLVLATVHGDTCSGALTRMMSLLGEEAPGYWKVLSTSLIVVVRQALVPTVEGNGWQVVADALINKGAVTQLLSGGDGNGLEKHASGPTKDDTGWISMNDNLRQLIKNGTITPDAARRETTDVKGL